MTRHQFPELDVLRVEVGPQTRDLHLAEITRAVRSAPPIRHRTRSWGWRRWLATASSAAVLATPAAAMASNNALPGDLLYPVKRLLEPVVRLVDQDVVAQHRVEEIERLVGSRPHDALDLLPEAETAVAVVDDPELTERLRAVVDVIADHPQVTDAPPDHRDDPPAGATTRDEPREEDSVPSDRDAPPEETEPIDSDSVDPVNDHPHDEPADDDSSRDGSHEPGDGSDEQAPADTGEDTSAEEETTTTVHSDQPRDGDRPRDGDGP